MNISKFHTFLHQLAEASAWDDSSITVLCTTFYIAITVAFFGLIYYLLAKLLCPVLTKIFERSENTIDNIFFGEKELHAISLLFVVWMFVLALPGTLTHYPSVMPIVSKISRLVLIAMVSWVISLEVNALTKYLLEGDEKRGGVLVLRNVLNVVIVMVAVLLSVSTIMDKDIAYVVSFLGAAAAAFMFVFKDSILGMVAGIRLSLNKMVRVGDWIRVPKYNADGRIIDVTLSTIKIRNWDESISTVPPYALMTEGFENREAMLGQGIRELKRTFYIDVHSVRLLTPEEIEKCDPLMADLATKNRPAVNLTLFRRYLLKMIESHNLFSTHPRHMVREFPVTDRGVPVEVYFFVNCEDWARYEELAADFVDEVIATIPRFGLTLFQLPSDRPQLLQSGHPSPEPTLASTFA